MVSGLGGLGDLELATSKVPSFLMESPAWPPYPPTPSVTGFVGPSPWVMPYGPSAKMAVARS
jgi:hypothetical protein